MSCIYYSIYFKIILFIINSFYDNEPNLTNLLKKKAQVFRIYDLIEMQNTEDSIALILKYMYIYM